MLIFEWSTFARPIMFCMSCLPILFWRPIVGIQGERHQILLLWREAVILACMCCLSASEADINTLLLAERGPAVSLLTAQL